MFAWEGNPCCPALAGVGVTNVTMICWLWGLITVNGGSEPEKGCQRDVHMLLCDMWHSVMRAQGQGQGHIIQQPFTVMSAGALLLCCPDQGRCLLKGVGVRGGRIVSNSGTWGEECVCLLIKQQQDMCVRVHSPCLPLSGPSLITPQSCVTTLFWMLGLGSRGSRTLYCLWW